MLAGASRRTWGPAARTLLPGLMAATRASRNCFSIDELVVQIRGKGRDLWLWLVLEPETKLTPVLRLGRRKQEVAYGVVHSLAAMLARGCVPAFTNGSLKKIRVRWRQLSLRLT